MNADVSWLEMKVDHMKTENAALTARVKMLEERVARLERALFGDGTQRGAIHD